MEEPAKTHALAGLLGSATLLSVLYLAMGTAVELLYKAIPGIWTEAAARAMDALPTGVLKIVGLFPWVVFLHQSETAPDWVIRLIYGTAAVAFFFVCAFLVGGILNLLVRLSPK